MNFLLPKNIFPTFFPIYRLSGKRFIFYHVKLQLTTICICTNIKYWTISYILISSFLVLIKKILNCVLTVHYKMKQLITILYNVNLLSNYGANWEIIVSVSLIFQYWFWFVNTFKLHTTIIQPLYPYSSRDPFICSSVKNIKKVFDLEKNIIRKQKKN